MSAYKKPQSIGNVLRALIKNLGIERKIDEARAVESWGEVAGPQINGVTNSAWVKGDVLFVKISSPSWRHALHVQRRQWRERLNEHLGADLVREIVFR